jgi:rhamnulokinase
MTRELPKELHVSANIAYVALDLGAESGRVVLGQLEDGAVRLEEVSRFPNRPEQSPAGLRWNMTELFRQSLAGIGMAGRVCRPQSIGVDSWGVDYGLLDERCELLGPPFHYRDRRTEGMVERAAARLPQARMYQTTGIRPMPINTVYQLLAEEGSPVLEAARHIVMVPDLFNYWLCGVVANEKTAASTTGLLEARSGLWAADVIRSLKLPGRLFSDSTLVEPGTRLAPLNTSHAAALDLPGDIPVVATASHDTAAAFAGVPSSEAGVAVLSSGTWSLLGIESDTPALSEAALAAGLSNERGVFGKVRLLRNVMGLWLLQQCRAAWAAGEAPPSYDELVALAASAEGEVPLFDPDDPSLSYPGDMPAKIEALVRESGQTGPRDRAGLVRSIFVSLACKYRLILEDLERLGGRPISVVHIVGGGARNRLLCQLTADVTRREVVAGPAEASALGNVLMQAVSLGHISGEQEMHMIARASVCVERYEPTADGRSCSSMYERFLTVTSSMSAGDMGEQRRRDS